MIQSMLTATPTGFAVGVFLHKMKILVKIGREGAEIEKHLIVKI